MQRQEVKSEDINFLYGKEQRGNIDKMEQKGFVQRVKNVGKML